MPTQRHEEKKEPWPFGSSFYVFSSPMGLPYVNWASQECCLFYLMSSLWSLDLPLTFLCSIFSALCHVTKRKDTALDLDTEICPTEEE